MIDWDAVGLETRTHQLRYGVLFGLTEDESDDLAVLRVLPRVIALWRVGRLEMTPGESPASCLNRYYREAVQKRVAERDNAGTPRVLPPALAEMMGQLGYLELLVVRALLFTLTLREDEKVPTDGQIAVGLGEILGRRVHPAEVIEIRQGAMVKLRHLIVHGRLP